MKQLKEKVKKEYKDMIQEVADLIQQAKKTGELNTELIWKETAEHQHNISTAFDEAEQRYRNNPRKFME